MVPNLEWLVCFGMAEAGGWETILRWDSLLMLPFIEIKVRVPRGVWDFRAMNSLWVLSLTNFSLTPADYQNMAKKKKNGEFENKVRTWTRSALHLSRACMNDKYDFKNRLLIFLLNTKMKSIVFLTLPTNQITEIIGFFECIWSLSVRTLNTWLV